MSREKVFLGILGTAGLLSLAACASVPLDAPPYTRAPAPPPGSSHLYVYRPASSYPSARSPSIVVGDKVFGSLPVGGYTLITLPPGTHRVKIDWPRDLPWPDLELDVTLPDQGSAYLKTSGAVVRARPDGKGCPPGVDCAAQGVTTWGYCGGPLAPPGMVCFGRGTSQTQGLRVPQEEAERELRRCCKYFSER
jgi:hypothetical protein